MHSREFEINHMLHVYTMWLGYLIHVPAVRYLSETSLKIGYHSLCMQTLSWYDLLAKLSQLNPQMRSFNCILKEYRYLLYFTTGNLNLHFSGTLIVKNMFFFLSVLPTPDNNISKSYSKQMENFQMNIVITGSYCQSYILGYLQFDLILILCTGWTNFIMNKERNFCLKCNFFLLQFPEYKNLYLIKYNYFRQSWTLFH